MSVEPSMHALHSTVCQTAGTLAGCPDVDANWRTAKNRVRFPFVAFCICADLVHFFPVVLVR